MRPLLFSLIFLTSKAFSQSLCPSGWQFVEANSFCYLTTELYLSLDEGIQYCNSINSHIIDIFRSSEEPILTNLTSSFLAMPWIGARRNSKDGQFYNLDGTSISQSYWAPGQPSSNGGDCVTIRGSQPSGLVVTPCYKYQPVVCRQQPNLCSTKTNYGGPKTRSGTITSPGYPVQYYNNLNCTYIITSPNATLISIVFTSYDVEDYDHVYLYDGDSASAPYLGNLDMYFWKNTFQSTGNALTVKFITDAVITKKGWSATWTAKSAAKPITQTGTNDTLASPNYPNNYDPYTEQIYYINVARGSKINVTIDDFNTQLSHDFLEVYSSSTISNKTLVANLSGSKVAPWNYLSPSNKIALRFTSDALIQKKGWHLTWFKQ